MRVGMRVRVCACVWMHACGWVRAYRRTQGKRSDPGTVCAVCALVCAPYAYVCMCAWVCTAGWHVVPRPGRYRYSCNPAEASVVA